VEEKQLLTLRNCDAVVRHAVIHGAGCKRLIRLKEEDNINMDLKCIDCENSVGFKRLKIGPSGRI
jgi:hypothetical protein